MGIIHYLNRHPAVAGYVLAFAILLGRLCGLHSLLLNRARELGKSREIEYALGFLAWFLRLRLGMQLPPYNIYHMVQLPEREVVIKQLQQRMDDYRVAKQYYLLMEEDVSAGDFNGWLQRSLEAALTRGRRKTGVKKRKFDTSQAFEALCRIDRALRSQGLRPFLVSGTLLGAVRDGALIAGDNDLDIGVFADEADSARLCDILRKHDEFQSVYDLNTFVQVTDGNGTVTDVFLHYRDDNSIWHGSDVHKWVNSEFDLAEITFQGQTFLAPQPPERYLDENYGNWQKQVLFWDYSFDTPNRQFFANRKTAFYLAERIIGEMKKPNPGRYVVQRAIDELRALFGIDLGAHLGTSATTTARSGQETTVITFGTFDLFHIGHLNILQRAASYGTRLVVGVSSDALNFSKKQTYPVYQQEDRMAIVRSIACVDEVFVEESLEAKRDYVLEYGASVLIMGADWEGKFNHLEEVCKVIYLPRTENISTTETKDAIKNNL
jgi:glycerol-3-phosphate cytidylyltransferase